MKDFANVLEEVLMEREEVLRAQGKLAEEIFECALREFENPEVNEVSINYDKENEKVLVFTNVSYILEEYSNLSYGEIVYKNVRDILYSNFEKMLKVNEQITIMDSYEEPSCITIKILEEVLEEKGR